MRCRRRPPNGPGSWPSSSRWRLSWRSFSASAPRRRPATPRRTYRTGTTSSTRSSRWHPCTSPSLHELEPQRDRRGGVRVEQGQGQHVDQDRLPVGMLQPVRLDHDRNRRLLRPGILLKAQAEGSAGRALRARHGSKVSGLDTSAKLVHAAGNGLPLVAVPFMAFVAFFRSLMSGIGAQTGGGPGELPSSS